MKFKCQRLVGHLECFAVASWCLFSGEHQVLYFVPEFIRRLNLFSNPIHHGESIV